MNRKVAVAPMMDCTDKHERYFLRLISKNILLYTEMIVSEAIDRGDRQKLLSFNLEEKGEAIDGEIYISLERVAENSKIFEQDFDKECKRVIIHSILHLLGFDDQTSEDKIKMTQLEDYYLSNTIGVDQI